MRRILAILTAVTGLTVSYPVLACSVAVRPVDAQVDESSELRLQAARLDSRAANAEASAAALDRQGDGMTARARELRNLVNVRAELDRERVLAQAQQLAANAAVSHAQAAQRRAEASQLRISARELRDRAVRVAGGTLRPGGGWRRDRQVAQTI